VPHERTRDAMRPVQMMIVIMFVLPKVLTDRLKY